jgi:hypothetical protein
MDAASLVSAWNGLVQQLALTFVTHATARTWQQIATGWVLHRGAATVTGIYRTLGALADRHWTVYHKFFYRPAWTLKDLSAELMARVLLPMIIESGVLDAATGQPAVDLNIDDTTAARYGKHVAHAGWYKDASAAGPATKGRVIHWAHNWVVGAFTVRLGRWALTRWVLPAAFALYRKRDDCDSSRPFATRQQLAARMVHQAAEALGGVRIRVAADGQYATRDMVNGLPANVSLVSRIRRDAAIYDLPPKRRAKGRGPGRPPKKGRRLGAPKHLAARRKKGWQTVTLLKQGRTVQREILGITCLWYHVCRDKPIRLVIVRDPAGRQEDDFLFCTDPAVGDEQIVQRFYDRWGVEEGIFEAKQFLGFEDTRGWCSATVNRQAPLAMVLVSLVKAWYAKAALDEPALLPEAVPWNPGKTRPSFADMLAALRRVWWLHRISPNSTPTGRVRGILESLAAALSAAA